MDILRSRVDPAEFGLRISARSQRLISDGGGTGRDATDEECAGLSTFIAYSDRRSEDAEGCQAAVAMRETT